MKTIKEILELDLPVFHKAYELAQEVHKDQLRSDGKPYMTHIDAVIENVFNDNPLHFDDYEYNIKRKDYQYRTIEVLLSIAALHDSVEDQPDKISYESIKKALLPLFGIRSGINVDMWTNGIVSGVKDVTKLERGKESYVDYVLRIKNNWQATMIKKSDLKHNMSDLKPGNMLDKYQLTMYVLNEK